MNRINTPDSAERKVEEGYRRENLSPVIKNGTELSTPVLLKLKGKAALNLHGAAGRIYMSLFSQNLTGEEVLELVDEKYKNNQTILERIVLEQLALTQSNDEKVKLDAQRYVLNYLNKGGELKEFVEEDKSPKQEGTLMDDFMEDIIEGIVESEKVSQKEQK